MRWQMTGGMMDSEWTKCEMNNADKTKGTQKVMSREEHDDGSKTGQTES